MKLFNTYNLSKIIFFLSIGFITILLTASCEIFNDDEHEFVDGNPCERIEPEISPDDKFACKINGEIWRATKTDFFGEVTPNWSQIIGDAERDLKNCDSIPSIISIGVTNPFIGDNQLSASRYNYCPETYSCIACYDIDTTLNRTITFSELDLEAGIANGTFSFQAVSDYCGDTVNITDGVFNLRW